ncbi:MAG TPA: hypothetical protein VF531_00165 [Bacillota bacterium]
MSIETLYELDREIGRLMIAGSDLAAGDFRLERLLPPLKQTGTQLPVFARIAGLVEQVIQSPPEQSAGNLLELTNLLHAVLYTQGEIGCPGDLEPITVTTLAGCTRTYVPYRRLRPVIEALTTKGGGRLEIISEADRDGLFQDLRLIHPLIQALDDSYPEVADLVFEILQRNGESILPLLITDYHPEGGRSDARKLELIAAIKGTGAKELYLEAVERGSTVVKVAAIKALKAVPEAEPLLQDLIKDRKKEIREAATETLKQMHPFAQKIKELKKAITKS